MSDAPIDKARCAQEPINIPGCIQPHGVLLVLAETDLTIAHVSANIETQLGIPAEKAIGAPLAALFGVTQGRLLEIAIRSGDVVAINPLRISLDVHGAAHAFDCVVHWPGPGVIVELEPCDLCTEGSNGELFAVHKRIARIQCAPDFDALFRVAAAEIQSLSCFDRVMVYRFDEDWNGEVVAEVTGGDDTPVKYLGLHFPATDIPEQARRLYLTNPLRLIPDSHYTPVVLVPERDQRGRSVDLSAAILRSAAPVHLEYLHNMGVRATLTISIVTGGRLWGLIACHHAQARHIDYRTRATCRLLGDMLAWQLGLRLEVSSLEGQLHAKTLVAAIGAALGEDDDLAAGLCRVADDLLQLFRAAGFALSIGGTVRCVGAAPSQPVIAQIAAELRRGVDEGVASSHCMATSVPRAAHAADCASGALFIALSEVGDEFLLIFRGEIRTTVHWGGDIRTSVREIEGKLHPRASFAIWEETVRATSLRWSAQDTQTAIRLRQIVVERAKAIERNRAQQRISFLAYNDVLTQLPNRASMQERLQRAVARSEETGAMFAVLFVDLDHFKLINDTFGHSTGDRVLAVSAARMQRCLRPRDLVARYGGDEFVIILSELSAIDDADIVAGKIVATLAEPIVIAGCPEIYTTASVGIAVYPKEGQDAEALLQRADLAMYSVKQCGRNGFVRFGPEAVRPTYERIYLERRIRAGLDKGEFVPYYQPIVSLESGRIIAMEALARWMHPSRGLVEPVEFISLAEETGAVLALDRLMLSAACEAAATWQDMFGHDAPRVSVNVSPRQFRDSRFLTTVADLLSATGLAPKRLQLEITESVLIRDEPDAVAALRSLAKLGIGIAIDDFGTGYSSLSYLTRLPVDSLKIDGSFLENLTSCPKNAAIVRAIIAMARSLGLVVVAEGVETVEPLSFLRAERCAAIQGFVVARPLAPADAAGFIEHFDAAPFRVNVLRTGNSTIDAPTVSSRTARRVNASAGPSGKRSGG